MPLIIKKKTSSKKGSPLPATDPKRPGPAHTEYTPRTRGKRAGLTREMILTTCRERLSSGQELSIAAIAKDRGVAPNAIYSRFERGISALEFELAREVMIPLGRSISPKEEWSAYLRTLFLEAADLARRSPELARLIASAVASEPYVCPRLNERILFCLVSANVPEAKRATLMFCIMDVLVGLTSKPKPKSKSKVDLAEDVWAVKIGHAIPSLSEAELPQLAEHASLLKAATSSVGGGEKGTELAITYADFVFRYCSSTIAKRRSIGMS